MLRRSSVINFVYQSSLPSPSLQKFALNFRQLGLCRSWHVRCEAIQPMSQRWDTIFERPILDLIRPQTAAQARIQRYPRRAKKIAAVLLSAMAMFVSLELLVQIRSHVRYGQSILNAVNAESQYIFNTAVGLKTLRPNSVFPGSNVSIRTNSLGLRSKEIPKSRSKNSLRVAVVGASTVMGAYSASNESTFPALLEAQLQRTFSGRTVDVINAGIPGYGLDEQRLMLDRVIAPLKPDVIFVYPGINDFSGYCRDSGSTAETFTPRGLTRLSLPNWLLSIDLVLKNTVALREKPMTAATYKDPRALDLAPYRNKLSALVATAKRHGIPVTLATNARAYRRNQPRTVQHRLSESARYFNSCFSVDGLHTLYDRHNTAISEVGAQRGVLVAPLDQLIPGGQKYFADATHFTAEGDRLAANLLFRFLRENSLIKPL